MTDTLPADIRELLLLWAARDSGVLDALTTSAGTPETVAAETEITERAAEVFVDALADRGFIERVGEEFEPTNRLLGFLTKTDVRSIGRLPAALDTLDAWHALPETAVGHPHSVSEHAVRNELGAQWGREDTAIRAAVTAAVHAAPDAESVVVLRDGPGRHAREFLARGYDVTLVETPERGAAVASLLEPTAVRLETEGYLDSIPHADLVAAVDVTRRHTPDENRRWLAAAAAAAGTVVAIEPVRDRTPDAGLLAVETFATTGGVVADEATIRAWFTDADLDVRADPIPGLDCVAFAGREVQ